MTKPTQFPLCPPQFDLKDKETIKNMDRGNILAVDDEPNNLRLLSSILTVLGYKVRSVTEGSMALLAAQSAPPDLILLDVNMPNLSGYEVCVQLKADPRTNYIPVVFISANDEVVDKVKAFEVGGADYITKPFQTEEVLARIEHQLAIKRLELQLKEKNALLKKEIGDRILAEEALRHANNELQNLVMLDGLTQVANRRRFDQYINQEWQRAVQSGKPMAVILCDVDFFKHFNDSEGHQSGDDCLRQIALTICRSLSMPDDLIARYGGEEFAVILPETDQQAALQVAESIQTNIAKVAILHPSSSVNDFVTLSFGVASLIPTQAINPDILIAIADRGLYDAKAKGRNCIVLGSQG